MTMPPSLLYHAKAESQGVSMLPNNYPRIFVENFLPAMFTLAAKDYYDPIHHESAVRFLRSEEAEIISGGASHTILKMLENGVKPDNKVMRR